MKGWLERAPCSAIAPTEVIRGLGVRKEYEAWRSACLRVEFEKIGLFSE